MAKKLNQLFVACIAGALVAPVMADDHHHMHRFPKDVDAFHAVLAPIWHAVHGQERLQTACTKATEMEGLAKGIRSTDASQLVGAAAELKAKCQGDQANAEGALGDVHEAFHHLIEHGPAGKAL